MSDFCPLLSIVVPTKNRAKYAIRMIDSILAINSNDFELIVSDNSDDDSLESWVNGRHHDHRLKYKHVGGLLSMTDNHNMAFERICGEFVYLIGDDDAVLPDLIEVTRWAKRNGWDAVTPVFAPCYFWPDVRHWYWGDRQSSMLYVKRYTGDVREIDSSAALSDCLENAGQGVGDLPKVYHGLVRTACMLKIKELTGSFFGGVSPDVYGAIALGCVVERYCHIDFPVSVAGVAGKSNSGRAALKQHKGDLWSDSHMIAFKNIQWPEEIPEFFSVETVWGQASLEAIKSFQLKADAYNFVRLYAKCFFNHASRYRLIFHSIRKKGGASPVKVTQLFLKCLFVMIGLMIDKIRYYGKRLLHPTPAGELEPVVGGVDIFCAVEAYQVWRSAAGMTGWREE